MGRRLVDELIPPWLVLAGLDQEQQARDSLADIVDMARWQHQVIEVHRYSKPVAYLVGADWFKRAEAALAAQAADELA
ncbi:hypothetical protein ACIOD2_40275 [Amycolatopsis sp. NPDC088138]|uniref:hypothetical protein n=1 Tax=Amycolatopsis sp. NPDC088138 TaxID=3363938 RepID=UPI0038059560